MLHQKAMTTRNLCLCSMWHHPPRSSPTSSRFAGDTSPARSGLRDRIPWRRRVCLYRPRTFASARPKRNRERADVPPGLLKQGSHTTLSQLGTHHARGEVSGGIVFC